MVYASPMLSITGGEASLSDQPSVGALDFNSTLPILKSLLDRWKHSGSQTTAGRGEKVGLSSNTDETNHQGRRDQGHAQLWFRVVHDPGYALKLLPVRCRNKFSRLGSAT